MPVIRDGRLAGVIYASRTPNNVLKYLFEERWSVLLASLAILAATALIGYVFWRGVTRPINDLMGRAQALGEGDRTALAPLRHYGTREVAELSSSIRAMAEALFNRTDYMRIFAAHVTHELKSPLTAIQGAAELMRDNQGVMKPEQHRQFLGNIIADTDRMTKLVGRLRELAEAESTGLAGSSTIAAALQELRSRFAPMILTVNGDAATELPLSAENLLIVLGHLVENAARNGAKTVIFEITKADQICLDVTDNGVGVSLNNRDKLFEAFFTTHRETGGTGMGLGIVRALLRGHGGDIALGESRKGARFRITLPSRG